MSEGDWVALAQVARPHGVRGALRLRVFNPDSDALLRARRVRMVLPEGGAQSVALRKPRPVAGGLLVELDDVCDRDAAEALRGARLEVPRSELDDPEEGAYYVVDLVGCEAFLGTERLGPVVDVMDYPTCDVLVVERDGERLEVPLLDDCVGEIDVQARRIEVRTLEGWS